MLCSILRSGRLSIALFPCLAALSVAACSGDDDDSTPNGTPKHDSGLPDVGHTPNDAGGDVSEDGNDGGTDATTSDANDAAATIVTIDAPPSGQPIQAQAGVWTEVIFRDDTTCRDGTPAGIRIFPNPSSDKLMIYLQGGGACSNPWSCGVNPVSLAAAKGFDTLGGILDRNHADNPVGDWNWVYVPYCTGDVHGGDSDKPVPGMEDAGVQHFKGYANMKAFLSRLVPTFPNVTRILHTGSSAGGFGAGLTAELVGRSFAPEEFSDAGAADAGSKDGGSPRVHFILLDDAGPPMTKDYVPTCLQGQWSSLWGFDKTILKDCGSVDCPNADDFSLDWSKHLIKAHPNNYGGLVSSSRDAIIRLFYGLGANNCSGDPYKTPTPMSEQDFSDGLSQMRTILTANGAKFGTYFINDTKHTWLLRSDFYDTAVGGVKLVDWVKDLINEKPVTQVGP